MPYNAYLIAALRQQNRLATETYESTMEGQGVICYVATHNESGKHYVGISKHGLKARQSQHEHDAVMKRNEGPFHMALREFGKDAFAWRVVAEGEAEVIKLLEQVLIERLGAARLGGFNAVGGLNAPPARDVDFDRMAEGWDREVEFLHMLNDLELMVRYCEEESDIASERLVDLRDLGTRLLNRVKQLDSI